jgi:cell fate (sporulation/competence/biofilm development) regulator YlbF (YheA/YmcA/DUF963 family)
MSVLEKQALDMSALLLHAYDLSDLIKRSAEMADYLYWKQAMESDPAVQEAVRQFARKKEKLEECERFGRFHPDYRTALEEAEQAREQLNRFECVREFRRAEEALDDLLYTVATTIARAVSDSVKVPSNRLPDVRGCGAGGACSGNCGC